METYKKPKLHLSTPDRSDTWGLVVNKKIMESLEETIQLAAKVSKPLWYDEGVFVMQNNKPILYFKHGKLILDRKEWPSYDG